MILGFSLAMSFHPGLATAANGDVVKLRADHPDSYVVARGDTLWDISARFLEDPWRWPEVWSFNPQIEDPHLIYPGDTVYLEFDAEGRPVIKVSRGVPTIKVTPETVQVPENTLKMSPQIRSSRVEAPIATIPLDAIAQFLGQPRILSQAEIDKSGYVVASKDARLISGAGDRIYGRGIVPGEDPKSMYAVLRVGKAYRNQNAARDDILGYEAIHVADAQVEDYGDPSALRLLESDRETLVGDRLLPKRASDLDRTFLPRSPGTSIEGQIISVIDGVSRIGQFQTVVINRGSKDGVETGHVLAVFQSGDSVRDPISPKRGEMVTLPAQRAGLAMVYRTFDQVSYALIMESTRDMRVYDMVRNP
jgi:hypothetical protein